MTGSRVLTGALTGVVAGALSDCIAGTGGKATAVGNATLGALTAGAMAETLVLAGVAVEEVAFVEVVMDAGRI